MKRTFSTLINLTLCSLSFAQFDVYRPRNLVEGQPLDAAISQNNFISLSDSKLDSMGTEFSFKRNMYTLQGQFLVLANKPGLLISLGAGYAQERFTGDLPADVQEVHHSNWVSGFGAGSIGKDLFWRAFTAYGSYSGDDYSIQSNNHKYTQVLQLGKKWTPNFSSSLGILLLTNFGDFSPIPLAHLIYSNGPWTFDFLIPIDVNVRYTMNDKWYVLLQNKIGGRSYWYDPRNEALNYDFNELILKTEVKLIGVLWIDIGLSLFWEEELEWQDDESFQDIGSLKDPLRLNLSLFLRFPDLPGN